MKMMRSNVFKVLSFEVLKFVVDSHVKVLFTGAAEGGDHTEPGYETRANMLMGRAGRAGRAGGP